MPTLETYLKETAAAGVIDHAVRAHVRPDGKVGFYIHPAHVDGPTVDFLTWGAAVVPCHDMPPPVAVSLQATQKAA